jgi:tRNA(fMet)-specific endonuclease VapC
MVVWLPLLSWHGIREHSSPEAGGHHASSEPLQLMLRYMLDADTVSYALRGEGRVAARLLQRLPSEICISAITLAELCFGAEAKRSQRIRRAIRQFTSDVAVVPFDDAAAERFGPVAAALGARGLPIGVYDTLVAAHALSLELTLVTNNTRHFSRIPELPVENWA